MTDEQLHLSFPEARGDKHAGQQRLFARPRLSPSERVRYARLPALRNPEEAERHEAAVERAVPHDRYVPHAPSLPPFVLERLRPARGVGEWLARSHAARHGEGPKYVQVGGVSFIARPIRPSDGDQRVYWD